MYGENIKTARKKAKLTQEELARKLGVVRSTITMYERNQRTPDLDTICELSKILNVSTLFLLEGRNVMYLDDLAGASPEDIKSLLSDLQKDGIRFIPQTRDVMEQVTDVKKEKPALSDELKKLSDDDAEKVFMKLLAGKDKQYLQDLAYQILTLANTK